MPFLCLILATALGAEAKVCARSAIPGQGDEWFALRPDAIHLGGVLGWRIGQTISNNFMRLDLEDSFFRHQREKDGTGLGTGCFTGIGKLADAAVYLARYAGDAEVLRRKEQIVSVLIDNQGKDGYLGWLRPEARLRRLWDLHDMGFIIQGLVSDYEQFGNKAALESAKRGADYILEHWKEMPPNYEFDFINDREWTLGLCFGLIRLYANTGDLRYRSFVLNERSLKAWDWPIVIGRGKLFYGQAYGYLGTALAQLEMYALEPDAVYLRPTFRALDFLLHGDGTLVTGTGGIVECWTNDQDGEGCAGETCFTVYELMVFDRLIRLGAANPSRMGDLMERTIYNALFAAQSRDGRRLRYYTPLNGERHYYDRDWYCCPNNFRRGISRIPCNVFYVKSNAVYANLYTPCEARVSIAGIDVEIRETTDYPSDGRIRFEVNPAESVPFSFDLRLPRWCRAPRAKVNGVDVNVPFVPGTVMKLSRTWKSGDVVELDLPMELRAIRGRKRQSGRFCVMHGPVVYALDARYAAKQTDLPETHREMLGRHPHDVGTILTMDPKFMTFIPGDEHSARPNGTKIVAHISRSDISVVPSASTPTVTLSEYADPDSTLVYFGSPDICGPEYEDDELYAGDGAVEFSK